MSIRRAYQTNSPTVAEQLDSRNRRLSPVAAHFGDCLLSELIAGTKPYRRELVFMPQNRPLRQATLTALSLGGTVWLDDHEAKRFGQTKPLGHGVAASTNP